MQAWVSRGWRVGVAAIAGAVGCSDPVEVKQMADPLPVDAVTVEFQDSYEVTQRFSGVARSRRSSALGFERGGKVRRVLVDDGDRVRAGQLLAELDRSQLLAGRKRIEASLREVEASVGLAELTAKRISALADDEYTSAQSSDEARFGLARAQARQDSLAAQLREIDVSLGKTRLYAPFSGVVSKRLVDEGVVVSSGVPVVRFLEQATKEAAIGVPATVAQRLKAGDVASVEFEGEKVETVLGAVVNDVNARTQTTSLIVSLPPEVDVADGETVTLLHEQSVPSRGFWVPLDALTQGVRGMWNAYKIDKEAGASRVKAETVQILHTEIDRAFVRGSLEPGDRIVASGMHRLVPGQVVAEAEKIVSAAEPGE
ncbi:MAG: efflux RND transporter periplasmic adaptor subunit [Myxococcota bacterium]